MFVGVEQAVLDVAKTAGARAVGPVTTYASMVLDRRRLRAEGRAATPSAVSEALADDLMPAEAKQIMSYVASPEFEELAFQLAMSAATARPADESEVVTGVRGQLAEQLRHHTGLDPAVRYVVADTLMDGLNQAVATYVVRNLNDRKVHGQVFQRHVTAAATMAAAQVRNTELLARIGDRSKVFDFSERLRRQVRQVHGFVEIQHIGSRQKVSYEQLWVKPRLAGAAVAHLSDAAVARLTGSGEPRLTDGVVRAVGGAEMPEDLAAGLRTVVLGDPGAGKSTLANWLAYAVAGDDVPGFADRVPFLLVLRDFATDLDRQGVPLTDHLAALSRGLYHVDPPPDAIEYLLRNGRALIILDGLDELVPAALRHRVVRTVEAFCLEYPTTPVVATAREVGYAETAFATDLFDTVCLAAFDDARVEEYVTKWFRLNDRAQSAPDIAAAFMRESTGIADLRSNPLLLALLCALYRWEGYLPENRPKVYDECTKLLLERWDSTRGIPTALPQRQSLRGVLADIAWWMWSDPQRNTSGVRRAALVHRITDYLARTRFDHRDEAESVAEQFVEFCAGRAWVLTEVGADRRDGIYDFTHRTFKEYFAAQHLARTYPTAEQLLPAVTDQITRGGGGIVAELAVHELDIRTMGGSDFLDALMDQRDDRSANLAFACRCLSFTSPRESTMRRIVDAAVDLACAPGRHGPLMDLLQVVSRENRPFVAARVAERLTAVLSAPDRTATQVEPAAELAMDLVGSEQIAIDPDVLTAGLRRVAHVASWATAYLVEQRLMPLDEAFAGHGVAVIYDIVTPRIRTVAEAILGSNEAILLGDPRPIVEQLLALPTPWAEAKYVQLALNVYPDPAMLLDRALEGSPDPAVASLVLLVGLPCIEAAGPSTLTEAEIEDLGDRLAAAELVPGCRDLVMQWLVGAVRLTREA